MSQNSPVSSIEVFPVPDWKVIHEGLEKGFDAIFPDIGEEITSEDRYWLDQSILGKKIGETQLIAIRARIRDSFLAFIEPILFDLYYNEQNWDIKVYPMNEYMRKIALYLVSGIKKNCSNIDPYYPLWTLWSQYVPEEQKSKFPRNIFMEISESGAVCGRGNFSLEIKFTDKAPTMEQTPGIITNTTESVDFLLQHPADEFDACIQSLVIHGENKDVINEGYTTNYLRHIRIVMVNRIWQDIYRAMKEPNKDWHFEYRESDLAMIFWHKYRSKEINEIFQKIFPSLNIIFRIDSPYGGHGGEYQPAIIIDVRSKERRKSTEEDVRVTVAELYSIFEHNKEGVLEEKLIAIGGYQSERKDFFEILSYPSGSRRTEPRDTPAT